MEDPQEKKQQFIGDHYVYQKMDRDVEMKEVHDDEAKAEQLCADQIEQLCMFLKMDFKETPNDVFYDLGMRLDKLQCKKVLVQAFGGKSQTDIVETPQKNTKRTRIVPQGLYH